MPDIFKRFHKAKRKGVTIAESIILMIVVVVTFGALFSTMTWVVSIYTTSKADKESRALYFAWVQAFESIWPTDSLQALEFRTNFNAGLWKSEAKDSIELVCKKLWGTSAWRNSAAHVNGFTISADVSSDPNRTTGNMELHIIVSNFEKTYVDVRQLYNIYTNGRVSDVVSSDVS